MSDVDSEDRLTCVRSTVVAICFAINRRQGRLRSRLDVRFTLAVSRVAVLFHNLDFRLQTKHKLFPSVTSQSAHSARVFSCKIVIDLALSLNDAILALPLDIPLVTTE